MASRKPAPRTGSTRQQQQRPAARGNGSAAAQSRSSGNGSAGKPRSSGNQAAPTKKNGSAPAARTAARGATASQPAAPAAPATAKGPLGRLLAPWRTMGWLPLTTFVLSLYGLGDAIYESIAHFDTHVKLACSDTGLFNCQTVTTSSQSMVFGVLPVAVLGMAFFVFMVAINSPWGWRLSRSQPLVHWARLGSVVVGIGFVLYLVYVELIQLNAICPWCTTAHVAMFLIFVLVVWDAAFGRSRAPVAAADRAAARSGR